MGERKSLKELMIVENFLGLASCGVKILKIFTKKVLTGEAKMLHWGGELKDWGGILPPSMYAKKALKCWPCNLSGEAGAREHRPPALS